MKALILLAAFLMGCAIAIGDNSTARVNTEGTRQVDIDNPVAPDAADSKRVQSKKENPR